MLPVHSLKWTVDMNRECRIPDLVSKHRVAAGINTGVLLIVALAVLVIVLGTWLLPKHNQPALVPEPAPALTQSATEPQVVSPSQVSQDEPPAETKRTTLKPRVSSVPATEANPSGPPRPEPSPMTRQLVTSLSQLDVGHG